MNGRKAKQLRRLAKVAAYTHYKSLLEEEQAAELTIEQAVQFTPDIQYVEISAGSTNKPDATVICISQNTLRWFVKLSKKRYG